MFRRFSNQLLRLSPLDGRYQNVIQPLPDFLSEGALMKYRVRVEVQWFIHLANNQIITHRNGQAATLSEADISQLNSLWQQFSETEAEWIKQKEAETNHDLKAVEYFLKDRTHLKELQEFFHICCTSEDINNLSYSLMFQDSLNQVLIPTLNELLDIMSQMAVDFAAIPMLGRTHGQPATPTTLGKEMAYFAYRCNYFLKKLNQLKLTGKCNGAVGNYNAHVVTFPNVNWLKLSSEFVKGLGLEWNPYSTQIEPHDTVAEMCGIVVELNTVLLDFARNMWGYISLHYFKSAVIEKEVGSSTMPHKVNPIYFENAEGNLGIANAVLTHLQQKLPVSRFQRDLSDSTAIRNIGVGLAHSLISYKSLIRAMRRITVNERLIAEELNEHWEVLAEPVQMVLRREGHPNPYELVKSLTRGLEQMNQQDYQKLVQKIAEQVNLDASTTETLMKLTPATYIGLAQNLAENISDFLKQVFQQK